MWRWLVSQDQELLRSGGASLRLEDQARPVRARTVWEDEACDCLARQIAADSMHKRRDSGARGLLDAELARLAVCLDAILR